MSYDNGKMEAGERNNSLETIQRARGDGTALWRYLRAVVASWLEALALGGEGMDTGNRCL